MIVPLDNNMNNRHHNGGTVFLERAGWNYTFAWLPHRCVFSKRIIWMEQAYRGRAVYNGFPLNVGEPVIETRWARDVEFIIWQLKS